MRTIEEDLNAATGLNAREIAIEISTEAKAHGIGPTALAIVKLRKAKEAGQDPRPLLEMLLLGYGDR